MTATPSTVGHETGTANRIKTSDGGEFLRAVLVTDGIATGLGGLAYLLAVGPIGALLGLPAWLLIPTGALYAAFGVALVILGTRRRVERPAIVAVWVVNAVLAIDCLAVAFTGAFAPTGFGIGWMVALAIAIAVVSELEYVGWRRMLRARD